MRARRLQERPNLATVSTHHFTLLVSFAITARTAAVRGNLPDAGPDLYGTTIDSTWC